MQVDRCYLSAASREQLMAITAERRGLSLCRRSPLDVDLTTPAESERARDAFLAFKEQGWSDSAAGELAGIHISLPIEGSATC